MKIGFVAFSGVRAHDKALTELGFTLPGFVERSRQIASMPSLGLLTLAGMTPDAIERGYYEIEDLNKRPKLIEELFTCDLVALSSFSAQIKEAYELSGLLRARGVKTIIGGIHVTSCPEEAAQHCDAIATGEGEIIWPKVIEDLQSGTLQKHYDGLGLEFDLSHSPMPAYELLDLSKYNRLTVQTTRGCPFACEFCASSILLTRLYKQKPLDNLLAEIDFIKTLWDKPFIEFADDNSFVNKKFWKKALPEIAKRNLRWFTETDISVAEDDELLELMRQSGCAQVLIGLESPSADALHNLELKTNWKQKQFDKYAKAIENIQSHGISVNGCFVLGLDSHQKDVFQNVYEFVRSTNLHEVQITVMTAFPGTPLYKRLLDEGRIIEPGVWEKCTLFDVNIVPKNMSAEELAAGLRDLMGRLYSKEESELRKKKFKNQLRRVVKKKRTS